MREKKLEDIYLGCEEEGIIKKKEDVDIELIESLVKSAKQEIESYKNVEKSIKYYSILFNMKYDILRKVATAYILFEKIKIDNHQCLFAYLCRKHKEFDFEWDIFESFRINRNSINYEGREMSENAFKEQKIRIDIYTHTLLKEAERKIVEWKD